MRTTAAARDGHTGAAVVTLDAVFDCDERDVIRSWSRGAEHLLGYPARDVIGRPVDVLVPVERIAAGELAHLREELRAQGGVHGFETERLTSDGRRVAVTVTRTELVDETGAVRGYCCVLRNVNGTYALLDQLYDAEKLAALRAMAAGIAHEVGNPLAGVLGLLQMAERKTADAEIRTRLGRARAEVLRVAQIVRELTDFTRANGETGPIDVNAILKSAAVFARYAYPAAPVAVRMMLDSEVPTLAGSATHFLQACLHVIMNAYDSMSGEGGTLTLTSVHRDGCVVLRIEDTGCGMTPEVRARIFDPFFTTKARGAGTGLGLFVCRRIVVEEFGGTLEVDSTPGAGTQFCVKFPLPRGTRNA